MYSQVFRLHKEVRSQETAELGREGLRDWTPEGRTSHCSTGRGREHITVKRICPPSSDPSPVPAATHQTIFVVLGHLTDKLIQLQAAGANDLDPEVVRMFRGRDIDF